MLYQKYIEIDQASDNWVCKWKTEVFFCYFAIYEH